MANKTPVQTNTDAFAEAQTAVFANAGGPGGVQDNVPLAPGPSLEEQAVAKVERQKRTTFTDKVGSMWRQDGIVDGLVAHYAGSQMMPDPKYTPFEPNEWKELSAGIADEHLDALYDSRSAAHARYIRERLLEKQEDQQRLADLGPWGTAGRFAFGAVMPDQILAGMVGGRVAQAVKWGQVARANKALVAAKGADEVADAAAVVANAKAKVLASEGSATSLLAGAAAGGAGNAAFEKIRQNYNFEDDSTSVLTAGLMGAGMSAPFGMMHAKQARRLSATALREAEAVDAFRLAAKGEPLTERQAKLVDDAMAQNKIAQDLEAGKLSTEEAIEKLGKLHKQHEAESGIPRDPEAANEPHVDVEAPEGFIAKGSFGSGQVAPVSALADERTAFARARFDIYSVLNGSENPAIRSLAFSLVKDPIQGKAEKHYAQGWTASEWKSHFVRTHKGHAMSDMRDAYQKAIVARGVPLHQRLGTGFEDEFHELVTRVVRGDKNVLAQHPDIAPMLSQAAASVRRAYDEMLGEATAAGVKGTDTLAPGDNYVNRVWHHEKLRDAAAKHGGWDAVERLVAGAIKVPGLTGDLKKAKKFVSAVRKLEFSPVMHDIMLHARDMGTLRNELRASGNLTDGEIDDLIDVMFEAKPSKADAGQATNLKYRFDLDENFSVKTAAGELRISDLLENDSRYLLDTYFNSMAGHTALAKHGITSHADFNLRMQGAEEWFQGNVTKGDKAQRDLRYLRDIYANITGRPMSIQDFSTTARIASVARAYTRSVMLGQLGFAAAFEMKQAAALFGFKAMMHHMPSLGGFIKAVRSGHVPDAKLARDVTQMVGFANELGMSYARHAEVTDGFAGRQLNRVENFANKASHVVDKLSGNASFTSITRNWSARMFAQKALDFAHNPALMEGTVGGLKRKWRERMVGWGVNDDDLDHVLAKLKEHAEVGPSGRLEGIKYEDWSRNDHASYETFQLAMSRAARDAVQDQDLGETAMFMHSTLGKVFAELKTFFLVAHAKNMLKNAHYRDATAVQVWTIGLLGESMAYITQTAANYAHDPVQLEKRLSLEKIATAAAARMSAAGMLPFLLDTGFGTVTGKSLVQPGMTTNTDNRTFVPPSLIMAQRLWKAPKTLLGLTGLHDVTQQDARDLAGTISGSRLLGISNGINYFTELLPKTAPSQGR